MVLGFWSFMSVHSYYPRYFDNSGLKKMRHGTADLCVCVCVPGVGRCLDNQFVMKFKRVRITLVTA